MASCWNNVPKAVLMLISIISSVIAIGLLVHILAPSKAKGENGIEGRPIVPTSSIYDAYESHLGIYPKAAIAVDAGPCASVSRKVMQEQNGTVVDAAIAGLFCSGVVHPHSMGIGAGFIMTIYQAKERKSYSLMAREVAPLAATEDMYLNSNISSRYGIMAVAVPGEVKGYEEAKNKFGNPDLTFAELIQPTIRMCKEGIPMTRSLFRSLVGRREKLKEYPHIYNLFIDPMTKDFYKIGQKYRRPMLATTLERIAKNGASEIYGPDGETGKNLLKDIEELKGIITQQDLTSYQVRWEDPVVTKLSDGYTVMTSPPPASGSVLSLILNTLSHYNLTAKDAGRPVTYQRFVEACKYGFAKRSLLGDWADPDSAVELKQLVSELTSETLAKETKNLIRDDKTFTNPGHYGLETSIDDDQGTAHFAFIDSEGNAVSVTSTINFYFGSGIYSKSTGIILNNQMDDFSTPGQPNGYGIEPSPSNYIKPGRRPVSSMVPTIITDKVGDVKLLVGAAGGPKIITGTAFVAMNHLWLGKNIKEAIDAKRVHHQLLPMKVVHDIGLDEEVTSYLKSVGHQVEHLKPTSRGSVVQGIAIEKGKIRTANFDYRKSGGVDGF